MGEGGRQYRRPQVPHPRRMSSTCKQWGQELCLCLVPLGFRQGPASALCGEGLPICCPATGLPGLTSPRHSRAGGLDWVVPCETPLLMTWQHQNWRAG